MSRNVKRLVEAGWATAEAAADPRRQRLALTLQGEGMLREAYPAWRSAQERVRRVLSADLVDMLGALPGTSRRA